MKRLTLALAMTAALFSAGGLAACSTFDPLGNTGGIADATLVDEKALIAAELAYDATATSLTAAVRAGFITAGSPEAVRIADLSLTAEQALDAAGAAQRAGDADTLSLRIAESLDFIRQANALIKGAAQ